MMLNMRSMLSRAFSTTSTATATTSGRKVAVLGAAGGIGQPLSLLLKSWGTSSGAISHLALYDLANMGMAVDLAHIPTPIKVTGHSGKDQLAAALQGAEVVVIPAGVPRKPGMTRDDLFNINAGIVRDLSLACAQNCPKAHLLIISNPVNSTVPISYETLKKAGVSQPSVFGVTTLDVSRAKTFVGEAKNLDPRTVHVNVIGGHSGPTIVPLFSTCQPTATTTTTTTAPALSFSEKERDDVTFRVQYGGDEVVKAKDGAGSATLSMAFAANEFVQKFIAALNGQKGVIQNTFIYNSQWNHGDLNADINVPYFAGLVELGTNGFQKILPLPKLSPYEADLLLKANEQLKKDIAKGVEFAQM